VLVVTQKVELHLLLMGQKILWRTKYTKCTLSIRLIFKNELNLIDCNEGNVFCRKWRTSEEKDPRTIIDSQLKFHKQVAVTISKARRLLRMISRCFILLTYSLSLLIVRPCLEYGNIWGPNYKVDEDEIKQVQRYTNRLVPSIKHLPYEECLRSLKLQVLETTYMAAWLSPITY